MNATAQLDDVPAENALAVLEQVDADPRLILLGKADRTAYMAQLRASVAVVDADIDTKAGRDRIKSAAQSIRTRKAEIDRARKGLTEHWRQQTAKVNEAGKVITADLDALIEEVRAPVTAWEKAEEARIAEADRIIAVAEENDPDVERYADVVFWRPACPTLMSPLVDVVPLQLFAMDMAKLKGYDVDKPRNLAKSVTVE